MAQRALPPGRGTGGVYRWAWAFDAAKGIDNLSRKADHAAMLLSALSIALIAAIVCLEVFLRKLLGLSTLISSEYSGYLLVACTLLGMAWTLRDDGFIRVDLFYAKLRGRALHAANFVIAAIGTVTTLIFTYYVSIFTLQSYEAEVTSIDVTRTPLWIPQLVMPIGAVLLNIVMIIQMVRAAAFTLFPNLAGPGEDRPAHESEGWL